MEIRQTAENMLSHSKATALINAPIEQVDIADWLFNLPDTRVSAVFESAYCCRNVPDC